MQSIAKDAQRMSLLFQWGVATADEIISWADSLIVHMDSPLDSLLELSTTSPAKTGDILSCLHRLSGGADFWAAFRCALHRVRDYVASHPERAEAIANHLFLAACGFSVSDVPDDLHFAYRFDDAFSLAREGTCGEPQTVYRGFIHELDKFTQVA
jgi:hypothetical protein